MSEIRKTFVLYDERGRTSIDDATVLVTAANEKEARGWGGQFGPGSIWYEFDVEAAHPYGRVVKVVMRPDIKV